MKPGMGRGRMVEIVVLGVVASWIVPVAAQNRVEGKLETRQAE